MGIYVSIARQTILAAAACVLWKWRDAGLIRRGISIPGDDGSPGPKAKGRKRTGQGAGMTFAERGAAYPVVGYRSRDVTWQRDPPA